MAAFLEATVQPFLVRSVVTYDFKILLCNFVKTILCFLKNTPGQIVENERLKFTSFMASPGKSPGGAYIWVDDEMASACSRCKQNFTMFFRKV